MSRTLRNARKARREDAQRSCKKLAFWLLFTRPSETVAHERTAVGEASVKSEQHLSFVYRYAPPTGSQHYMQFRDAGSQK